MNDWEDGYMTGFREASAQLGKVVAKLEARFAYYEKIARSMDDNIDWALGLRNYRMEE